MKASASRLLTTVLFLLATSPVLSEPAPAANRQLDDAERFVRSVREAIDLLHESHIKEKPRGQLLEWAIRGLYQGLKEELPPELAMKLRELANENKGELKEILLAARRPLGHRRGLEEMKDIDLALSGIFEHLEPQTKQVPQAKASTRIHYSWFPKGIGVKLRVDRATGMLRVVRPWKDWPAHKAGVRSGDLIERIDSEKPRSSTAGQWETTATTGLTLEETHERLLGRPGTKVKLSIRREGVDEPIELTVERARESRESLPIETVFGVRRKEDLSWDHVLDSELGVAYFRITDLSTRTEDDMKVALARLESRGLRGVIIDLRFLQGMYAQTAIELADQFIDSGLLCDIRARGGRGKEFKAEKGGVLDVPLVCLVNGNTAKCAEVLAAALQDHRRAVIIGERTAGSAEVQNVLGISTCDGHVRFTTAVFVRPSGKNLSKYMTGGREDEDWGVRPDPGFEVKLTEKERGELAEHLEDQTAIPRPAKALTFRDRQLEKSLEHLRWQIKKPE